MSEYTLEMTDETDGFKSLTIVADTDQDAIAACHFHVCEWIDDGEWDQDGEVSCTWTLRRAAGGRLVHAATSYVPV